MAIVVLEMPSAAAVGDVRDICNYKIGGPACSACCTRARRHCRLYCMLSGCDVAKPGVCDVTNSDKYFMQSFKAKGCQKCSSSGDAGNMDDSNLSLDDFNSMDSCTFCLRQVLKGCNTHNCNSAKVRKACYSVCLN